MSDLQERASSVSKLTILENGLRPDTYSISRIELNIAYQYSHRMPGQFHNRECNLETLILYDPSYVVQLLFIYHFPSKGQS